jgi:hypothetical protein
MVRQPLDVVNAALSLVVAEPLASLDTSSPVAEAGRIAFSRVVEAALARHRWRFALRREALQLLGAPTTTAPPGLPWAFAWPTWALNDPELVANPDGRKVKWTREGQTIWAETSRVDVLAVQDVGPEHWPALFFQFVVHALAADLADTVAMNPELAAELRMKAFGRNSIDGEGGLLRTAREADGRGEPSRQLTVKSSLVASFGGY